MKRTSTATWHENLSRWQINVQKDGKRRSFYSSLRGRNGQRECHAKADAWLDDNMNYQNTKVSVLFAAYIEELKLSTSKTNWSKVQSNGNVHILPKIGGIKISNINEQHLQNVINIAYSKGLSKKTISNIKADMTSFIKYCRKSKATTLFPENLTIPKGAPVGRRQILQPEHFIKLFATDKTMFYSKEEADEYIHAYRFQVLTGLRPGELMGLRWSDIKDYDVFISRSINDEGEVTHGKNDNAIRHFVMSDLAKHEIDMQRKMSTSASVFEITSQSVYRKRWHIFCALNNIPKMTPYELRHTFISIAKNLPDGAIRPLVGHSKNMDTFGIYGHEVNGQLKQTADNLAVLFESILKTVL